MNSNKQHKDPSYGTYQKADDYYEYENYQIEIENKLMDRYELMEKIGRGKYSDVFKCIDTQKNQHAVIKVLKPVRDSKIKREIKILKCVRGNPNIIELLGVTYDECTKTYCLVHPYVNHTDIRDLHDNDITLPRIKKYIYQILKALLFAHKCGIMHRDIKPQNVLYDKDTEQVFVADWGLADYYFPMRQYNVRVASRYYKGPQLLLNNKYYGYSLDIWSLGCVLVGLIFQKSTFFRGDSNPDQIRAIMQYLGTQEVEIYIKKYNLKPDQQVVTIMQNQTYAKRPWASFITQSNCRNATKQAIDLISRMLVIDHNERITCEEALKHPFFKQLSS